MPCHRALPFALLVLLAGCRTQDAGGGEGELVDLQLAPDSAVHGRTSYALGRAHARCTPRGATGAGLGFMHAYGWLDLDGDGDDDQLSASGSYPLDGVGKNTPFQARLLGDGGAWSDGPAVFTGSGHESMHPRKLLVGELNGDGWMDAVVVDHGYDAPPWPGAPLRILLSDGAGHLSTTVRDDLVGYHHGGALGDLDGDGDLDLVLMDNPGLGGPHLVLLNDGEGTFTSASGRLASGEQIFTAELFDLDGDGYLDLAVGGHEFEGGAHRILWGSSRGSYSSSLSKVIPAVPGYGVLLDFDAEDIDGDGDRDLIVLRTGGGPGGPGFYQGRATQILVNGGGRTFTDESATRLADAISSTEAWFDWLFVFDQDGDGDVDLCNDRAGAGWINDGTGHFEKPGPPQLP